MSIRMIFILMTGCLIALLILAFWQVQQTKLIQHQLKEDHQLKVDIQRMLQQSRQIKPQLKQAMPAQHNANDNPPAAKPAGAPDAAKALLNDALAGLLRAIKANDAKELTAAAAEVPAIKDAVWKTGDLWPKYKTALHELMSPLDYAIKRLKRGDQADFSKALKTVKALLRKGKS